MAFKYLYIDICIHMYTQVYVYAWTYMYHHVHAFTRAHMYVGCLRMNYFFSFFL